jgi:O-phosphoseryl-tRNA(Cys) synthetase
MNQKERSLLILDSCREILSNMTEDEVEYRLKIVRIKSIEKVCNTWRKGQIKGDEAMHEVMNILMMFE